MRYTGSERDIDDEWFYFGNVFICVMFMLGVIGICWLAM